MIERAHQTAAQQAVTGQVFAEGLAFEHHLSDHLDFLNQCFPPRSLGGQAPLQPYAEARHSYGPIAPNGRMPCWICSRVYAYPDQGRWLRPTISLGQFSLGIHRYGVGKHLSDQTLEINYDPQACEFKYLSEDGRQEFGS